MIKVSKEKDNRLCQGDVIKNVELIEYADIDNEGNVDISKVLFPYVIVLTQDCDLEQDFKNRSSEERSNEDKHILSIIVAPLYNAEQVVRGVHLSELQLSMSQFSQKPSKTDNRYLRQNQNPRYHFLQFDETTEIVDSVIDFKHYFTVNNLGLLKHKDQNFICQVAPLYREQISLRFSNYLARIGLPEPE